MASAMRICQPPENVSAGLSKSACVKPEPLEHLRHAQLDAVAFLAAEELGEVVVADEQRLVLAVGQRRIGQRVLDAVDFGARFEQRPERQRGFVDERAPGVLEAVLRQVADRQARRA